jgi:hypothetical protein
MHYYFIIVFPLKKWSNNKTKGNSGRDINSTEVLEKNDIFASNKIEAQVNAIESGFLTSVTTVMRYETRYLEINVRSNILMELVCECVGSCIYLLKKTLFGRNACLSSMTVC